MPKPAEKKFDEISVGEKVQFACTISAAMVDDFARLSGDYNPLHMSEEYAATTPFGRRIAHGMIAGALFSRFVGMHLPGLYSVYLSQTVQFKKPMYLGTEVVVEGRVVSKSEAARTLTLLLELKDAQTGEVMVGGEALVKVSA